MATLAMGRADKGGPTGQGRQPSSTRQQQAARAKNATKVAAETLYVKKRRVFDNYHDLFRGPRASMTDRRSIGLIVRQVWEDRKHTTASLRLNMHQVIKLTETILVDGWMAEGSEQRNEWRQNIQAEVDQRARMFFDRPFSTPEGLGPYENEIGRSAPMFLHLETE